MANHCPRIAKIILKNKYKGQGILRLYQGSLCSYSNQDSMDILDQCNQRETQKLTHTNVLNWFFFEKDAEGI